MGLTSDPNYRKLEQWYKSSAGNLNMRQMFDADQDRFNKFRWNTSNALPLRAWALLHIYTGVSSRLPRLHHIYRASAVSRTYILVIRPIWAHLLYITQFMHCFCKITSSFNIRTRISLHLVLHVSLDFHIDVARLLPHQANSLELQVPPSALLHLLYIFIYTHINTLIVCLTVYLCFRTVNIAILAARHITRSLIIDHVCLSSACTLTLLLCGSILIWLLWLSINAHYQVFLKCTHCLCNLLRVHHILCCDTSVFICCIFTIVYSYESALAAMG